MIYDLDTTLDFPCDFCTYVTDAIRKLELKEQYQRYFRVIPAEKYLLEFSSDRRHMRRPDGTWMVEQPSWPCIFASSTGHNIEQFWSMDPEIFSDWST
uniref:Protein N-terminal glutamine amidohydrolase n=1 Tax=Plectus sambesii TaxID=2011161 RepID=A0A914UX82_9BILA